MPILGIIENMSGFICPKCGIEVNIFKKGGGKKTAEKYNVKFLGSIPIEPEIVNSGDSGDNIFENNKTKDISSRFFEIIDKLEGNI